MKLFTCFFLLFFTFQASAQMRQKGPNGKWGFVDFDGEILLPYEYDEFLTPRLDTITYAKMNGKKGVLNEKGEVLIPFEYTEIMNWLSPFGYQNGLFAVSKSDKNANWGFIDKQGKVVLPLYYEYIRSIAPNLLVARPARDTILQFFDGKGQILFKMPGRRVEDVENMKNAFAVMSVQDRRLDRYYLDGTPFPPGMLWEKDGFVCGQKASGRGISTKKGKVIVPYEYQNIRLAIPGQWLVEQGENVRGVINSKGKFVIPVDTHYISHQGSVYVVAPVARPDAETMLDSTGRVVLPADQWNFSSLYVDKMFRELPGCHPERYLQVIIKKESRLSGLYSKDGTEILPIHFFQVNYCTDQHALLTFQDVGTGLMEAYNFQGKSLLDSSYRTLKYTADPGLLYGMKTSDQNRWGFIRLADRGASATFEYEYLGPLSEKYMLAKKGNMNQLLDMWGKPVTQAIYTRLSEPDKFEQKHFSRMPGFKGTLIAVARKADTPPNLVIGINEKGQEFLLDVEAAKAALDQKIANEKASYETETVVSVIAMPVETVMEEAPPPPPPANPATEKEEVYYETVSDPIPSFPGGEAALKQYIAEHLQYPAIAKEANIQGRVVLTFIVEKDGSLSEIQIIRDIGGGCGKEAIRMVESMPKWVPGTENGQPVRVKFTLPVTFRLEK